MKTFAQLTTDLLQALQDTGADEWKSPETVILLENAIREIPPHRSYWMREVFTIESRTGSATTTTSDKLVDSSGQFLSTDVGKEIYNTTDNTWAVVTAFDDANTLSLSKDIMVSGESYEMFNENCHNKFEIYIGDITDYVGGNHGILEDDAHAPEYPLGTKMNVSVSGDILTILKDTVPDSSDTTNDLEVFIWFRKKHRVSQLTDLAGTVSGTPAAGATTFTIAAVGSGTDVIAEDTLFTVANVRGTYRVKYDLTLSGGGGTIVFWPGLASAPSDGAIVAFVGSTLDSILERLIVQVASGKAKMSKALQDAREIPAGGSRQASLERQLGLDDYTLAIQELNRGKPVGVKQSYSRA